MKTAHRTIGLATLGILVLATVGLAASPGRMQGRMGRGPEGPGRGPGGRLRSTLGAVVHRLDLTDEQSGNIRAIMKESRQGLVNARRSLAEARQKLQENVSNGAQEQEIRACAEALGKAIANEAVLRSQTLASVKEVLTQEQREQLENLIEQPGPNPMGRGRSEMGHRQGRGWRQMGQRGDRMQRNARPRWSDSAEDRPGPRHGNRGPRFDNRASAVRGPRRSPRFRAGWAPTPPQETRPGRASRPLDRLFERADTNDDELLDREEIDAFRDSRPRGSQNRPW